MCGLALCNALLGARTNALGPGRIPVRSCPESRDHMNHVDVSDRCLHPEYQFFSAGLACLCWARTRHGTCDSQLICGVWAVWSCACGRQGRLISSPCQCTWGVSVCAGRCGKGQGHRCARRADSPQSPPPATSSPGTLTGTSIAPVSALSSAHTHTHRLHYVLCSAPLVQSLSSSHRPSTLKPSLVHVHTPFAARL